jgi:hypothetical protein
MSAKNDYIANNSFVLSDEQQQEILARDAEYEAGETETYLLDEVIAYFNIR